MTGPVRRISGFGTDADLEKLGLVSEQQQHYARAQMNTRHLRPQIDDW